MKINAQCETWLGQLTEPPVFKKNAMGFLMGQVWLYTSNESEGEFSEWGRKSNRVFGVRGGF